MSNLIIRHIKTKEKKVFLTFDDGPVEFTEKVLDLLDKHQAKATFFVVGNKVKAQSEIFKRILKNQHSIYSHSIDHNFVNLFNHDQKMHAWLHNSLTDLSTHTGQLTKLFRPPAGIITPPMKRVAKKENVKLILWNTRFFDSVHKLKKNKIDNYIKSCKAGDILLLHDAQSPKNQRLFLESLEHLISSLKNLGFKLTSLQPSDL